MRRLSYEEALAQIVREDPRYPEDAYLFLREGLDFTIKLLQKPPEGPGRHVTGGELLDGLRQYALQEFGPLARRVLATWGIRHTEDFGNLVFNLVGKGVLGKTAEDRLEDFAGGYDFDDAFVRPFLPRAAAARPRPGGPGEGAGG